MKILSTITDRIRLWYRGRYIERKNDPDSSVFFLVPGYYKQPLFARILRRIGRWLAAHWQWLIPIFVMLLGLLVNAMNLFLQCRHPV